MEYRERILKRKTYLDQLWQLKDLRFIKIVSGVRRCGKSTLLKIFASKLRENGISEEQIIEINFEDLSFEELADYRKLNQFILEKTGEAKKYYLFLDEIQQVKNFQKVVDSLHLRRNIDIYLTGSNSSLLSGEMATLLTGRFVEVRMLPLSLREFYELFPEKRPEDLYSLYLRTTSFPFIIDFPANKSLIDKVLEGLFSSIVIKDIVNRIPIRDPIVLEKLVRVCFSSVGNRISVAKLANSLTSVGNKTDNKTVEKYVHALCDSFVLYQADRWDLKGKELLKNLKKYYAVDIGLRRTLLGSESLSDGGHLLENVVYLELVRRGYKVYTGKWDDLEVDFVCTKEDRTIYIQVAASVRSESVLEREIKPLLLIKDNFPKFILTLDDDPSSTIKGIEKKNALEWLLETH